MLTLTFNIEPGRKHKVLLIGAHADDIEIGCGGTILRLVEEHPSIEFTWVVLTGSPDRVGEAQCSAAAFMGKTQYKMETPSFQESCLPYLGKAVKDFFERTLKPHSFDLILTHFRGDLHQDHRFACELTWNTFRDHLILEYEIPKYEGDLGTPNCYIPLRKEHVQRKLDLLFTHFASQRDKNWFQEETFQGLMRLRGMECQMAGYVEAFYGRKLALIVGR